MTKLASLRSIAAGLIFVLTFVCLTVPACSRRPRQVDLASDLQQFFTPALSEAKDSGPGITTHYLRLKSRDDVYFAARVSGAFATKLIYVYSISAREMTMTTVVEAGLGDHEDWQSFRSPRPGPVADMYCTTGEREGLILNGSCQALKGRSLGEYGESPSGDLMFVLSADGKHLEEPRVNFGVGWFTLRSYGQHYLQAASLEAGEFLGLPVRIAVESARDIARVAFLGGDDVIGVMPGSAGWISVVHVEDIKRRRAMNREQ